MIVFFLAALTIFALAFYYLGRRLLRPMQLPRPWSWLAWLIPLALVALPFALLPFRMTGVAAPLQQPLTWTGYIALGFFSLLLTFVVLWDLVRFPAKLMRKLHRRIRTQNQDAGPVDEQRRLFLARTTRLGLIAMTGALTGYGVFQARQLPEIVPVAIPIPNLPADLVGFRIVHLSDFHVGLTVRRDWVEKIVARANSLAADVIVITGDLVDGTVAELRPDVAPLAQLSARYGVFFVPGNHEYYSGVDAWTEHLRELSLTTLLNGHQVIRHGAGTVVLAGITDYSADRFLPEQASNPAAAFAGAPSANVRVLLAHQPRSLFAAAPVGFDLQLSGHTHNGQLFPWNYVAWLQQPFITGLHRVEVASGAGWVYVNPGTGYWGPPVRLGTRSEITLIQLTRAKNGNEELKY